MAIVIKWNKRALMQFDEAIKYIEIDSPINANTIRKEILFKIDDLSKYPEKYNPDKYKIKSDGSFRHLRYIVIVYPTVIKAMK